MKNEILVFTATYNESENIKDFLNSIETLNLELDLLLIDDNSPDKTWKIIQEYAKNNNLGLWNMNFHYPWDWRYKVRNLKKTKFPFKVFNVEFIYLLDNGKIIYVDQHGRGNRIWEKDEKTNELKEI